MQGGPFGNPCDRKRVIGTTGDYSPLDYGGGIVYRWCSSSDGTTYVTWEFWNEPHPEDESLWDENSYKYTIYRVDVPDSVLREYCTPFRGDCNIHNGYHAARAKHSGAEKKCTCRPVSNRHKGGWVKLPEIASFIGQTTMEWARNACSRDVMTRVHCLNDIVSYYGAENLDSYPIQLTGAEIKRRWRHHMKHGVFNLRRKTG